MADDLQSLYDKMRSQDPNLQSLHDITSNRQRSKNGTATFQPDMEYGSLRRGTLGELESGFGKSRITIDPVHVGTDSTELTRQVLHHEMTHAADHALGSQYFNASNTFGTLPETKQFVEGYEKLEPVKYLKNYIDIEQKKFDKSSPKDIAMYGRLADAKEIYNDKYRGSNAEMRAFGVGNSNVPKKTEWPGSSHLDPTLATEAAILRDLAERARHAEHREIIKKLHSK